MLKLSAGIGEKFPGKKIVIVGDLVADQFLRGTIARVSREAPVFILRQRNRNVAGAEANAASRCALEERGSGGASGRSERKRASRKASRSKVNAIL